jgi:hypothetical protein
MGLYLGIFSGGKSVGCEGDVLIMGLLSSSRNKSEQ